MYLKQKDKTEVINISFLEGNYGGPKESGSFGTIYFDVFGDEQSETYSSGKSLKFSETNNSNIKPSKSTDTLKFSPNANFYTVTISDYDSATVAPDKGLGDGTYFTYDEKTHKATTDSNYVMYISDSTGVYAFACLEIDGEGTETKNRANYTFEARKLK